MADVPEGQEIIQSFSVYLRGRKIATANTAKLTRTSGGALKFGDGKVLGFSKGIPTSNLTITTIVVHGGKSEIQEMEDALDNHTPLEFALGVINGSIKTATLWCTQADYDTNMETGDLTGSFTFQGGKPKTIS